MSDTENTPTPEAKAAPAPPPKPAAPARELPTDEGIAAWVGGEEYPLLMALFQMPTGAPMALAKFDITVMQIRKEEILPQHWQVIADHSVADPDAFDSGPEAGRLRTTYRDQEVSRRRVAALKLGWLELGGKQPSLWEVADLFAAMRRLIDRKIEVDLYELLCATRDVWRGMTLPHGKEQLEVLWSSLAFVRKKTKK